MSRSRHTKGTLGNLESFAESHVFFRSFGNVDASFVMNSLAQLTFTTGPVELFGMLASPSEPEALIEHLYRFGKLRGQFQNSRHRDNRA